MELQEKAWTDVGRRRKFSVCIPVYNNEKNLPITIPYIIDHLYLFEQYDVEIVMVNDGSTDGSYAVMKKYRDAYPDLIRIATLTRNFGQGACSHACYDLAQGDVIGVISADGQDPFELFADMLKEWEKGCKLVIASRESRDEKGLSVFCSRLFHKFMHGLINKRYPQGGFDFVLMDREVLDKYLAIDQVDSLGQLKLLWLGYEYRVLYYTRAERNSGKSGYKILKRVALAWETLVHNSALPIHMIFLFGIGAAAVSALALVLGGVLELCGVWDPTGLFYLIWLLIMGTGVNLTAVGAIGEYLWNQFLFVKQLPRYVIDEEAEYAAEDQKILSR